MEEDGGRSAGEVVKERKGSEAEAEGGTTAEESTGARWDSEENISRTTEAAEPTIALKWGRISFPVKPRGRKWSIKED